MAFYCLGVQLHCDLIYLLWSWSCRGTPMLLGFPAEWLSSYSYPLTAEASGVLSSKNSIQFLSFLVVNQWIRFFFIPPKQSNTGNTLLGGNHRVSEHKTLTSAIMDPRHIEPLWPCCFFKVLVSASWYHLSVLS